jgi:hypothetical protein
MGSDHATPLLTPMMIMIVFVMMIFIMMMMMMITIVMFTMMMYTSINWKKGAMKTILKTCLESST